MKKCIALTRVSALTQNLEHQITKLHERIIADGYAEDEILTISNKESAVLNDEEHLLGIKQMKEEIKNGDIEVVYCNEISRLSRQPKALFSIRDFLVEHKVQLVVLNPEFKLLTSSGEIDQLANVNFSLYSVFAENEGILRKERCARGKARSKSLGKYYGGKIRFGYRIARDKTYELDPINAPIVKELFDLYVTGKYSLLSLAKEFQSRGLFVNFRDPICAHTNMSNILKYEGYTGTNNKPAIVSRETFDKVQTILEQNARLKTRATSHKPVLGRRLIIESRTNRMFNNNAKNGYFVDITPNKTRDHLLYIKTEFVDPIIWYEAMNARLDKLFSPDNEKKIRSAIKRDIKNNKAKIKVIEQTIQDNDERLYKIEERIILGKLNEQRAKSLEARLNNERRLMEEELLQTKEDLLIKQKILLKESRATYEEYKAEMEALSIDEKAKICKEEIIQVVIRKQQRSNRATITVFPRTYVFANESCGVFSQYDVDTKTGICYRNGKLFKLN